MKEKVLEWLDKQANAIDIAYEKLVVSEESEFTEELTLENINFISGDTARFVLLARDSFLYLIDILNETPKFLYTYDVNDCFYFEYKNVRFQALFKKGENEEWKRTQK